MKKTSMGLILGIMLVAISASAQPTLDSLWPHQDGLRFSYDYHFIDTIYNIDFTSPAWLSFEGTVTTAGGQAQLLFGEHDPIPLASAKNAPPVSGLLRALWRARPNLQARILALDAGNKSSDNWEPYLLHTGYFMPTATQTQMWQESWAHPTWIFLEDDLSVGATFTWQLIPEIIDDIFLHGTVGAVNTTVTTPLQTFTNAVRMDYSIDLGVGSLIGEEGTFIGTVHGEIHGHVHYVPGVGPVEMLEERTPYVWAECEGGCPPDIADHVGEVVNTQTLFMKDSPVASESRSWGAVKSLYR